MPQHGGNDGAAVLEALRAAIHGCARCAALVRCRSRVVPGDGAVPATVAFVGLAPGRLGGDRTGLPFSGDRSGELLRRMIARSGLERVFITNLVRCNPRDARGRNRDPRADEIANCRTHLAAELGLARPRIIVALGALAWRELAGQGVRFEPRRPRARRAETALLYPMYHPGYIVRGARARTAYARDFARLAQLVRTGAVKAAVGTAHTAPAPGARRAAHARLNPTLE
ncbi:MAG TPA: uracil-DNA glycosylase [Candidatus Binataceae bacterium]|nr:uracil-DNA glycosylase [Candidatus Binataceae bacterium]